MIKFFAPLFFENKISLSVYASKLETNGAKLEAYFAHVGDIPTSRRVLRHIVAIERWGLSRLRMLLGEKPVQLDSSKAYYPAETTAWSVLLTDFKDVRRELVALTPFLESAKGKVAHNMMGDLSPRAWLKYLDFHANAESSRVRVKK
ncbi:MAG: hypothetical protein RLZZ156_1177 [Deinococcota bacterium]|jgi:hypothetical protein